MPQPLRPPITSLLTTSVSRDRHIFSQPPHRNAIVTPAARPPSEVRGKHRALPNPGTIINTITETQTNPSAHTHTAYQVPSSKPQFATVDGFSWLPAATSTTRGETSANAAKIDLFQRLQGPFSRHHPMPDGASSESKRIVKVKNDGSLWILSIKTTNSTIIETRIFQTLQKLAVETNPQDIQPHTQVTAIHPVFIAHGSKTLPSFALVPSLKFRRQLYAPRKPTVLVFGINHSATTSSPLAWKPFPSL